MHPYLPATPPLLLPQDLFSMQYDLILLFSDFHHHPEVMLQERFIENHTELYYLIHIQITISSFETWRWFSSFIFQTWVVGVFLPLKKNLHKNHSVNLLVINLHSRTSEMFLFSHLYLSFSIFNVFIMIFNCWSSIRKGHTTGFKLSCCCEYHYQWRYIFWMTLKSKINNE